MLGWNREFSNGFPRFWKADDHRDTTSPIICYLAFESRRASSLFISPCKQVLYGWNIAHSLAPGPQVRLRCRRHRRRRDCHGHNNLLIPWHL